VTLRSLLLDLRTSPRRRAFALGTLVVAAGGLILIQTPPAAGVRPVQAAPLAAPLSPAAPLSFAGDGAQGTLALSHGVVGPGTRRVYAELKLKADQDQARQRAPVSLVVALDTSGSMGGEKIQQAREAVVRLIQEMHDDDEIALVTYDSAATLRQPLAAVGKVRPGLLALVRSLQASGGTNIPDALDAAIRSLQEASHQRVRRVVLVSDGLDGGRSQSEELARQATGKGVALSSLGVGLDFDESYMASIARVGRGNFAFAREGSDLTRFLRQELEESASTRIDDARVRLNLPRGLEPGQIAGATASTRDGQVELQLGSLFAGEERRVIVELLAHLPAEETRRITGDFSWKSRKNDGLVGAPWGQLALAGTADPGVESRSLNGAVLASATSVLASLRQLEATEAYARGDQQRAQRLIEDNVAQLQQAQAHAPPELAGSLGNQASAYKDTSQSFQASPASAEGKTAAKRSYHQDVLNLKSGSY
jgi:Ca-activated chloride channel family protein